MGNSNYNSGDGINMGTNSRTTYVTSDMCFCGHLSEEHREALTATGSGCVNYLCDCGTFDSDPDYDPRSESGNEQWDG